MAAAKETKMNLSNLAKILGPTIIGYSSMEALPEEIMKEVGPYLGKSQIPRMVVETFSSLGGCAGGDDGKVDWDRQRLLEYLPGPG